MTCPRPTAGVLAMAVCLYFAGPAAVAAEIRTATSSVKLLDSGDKPRKALRLRIKKGQKDHVNMTMDMDMATELAGQGMPEVKLPTIHMTLEVLVVDVSRDRAVIQEVKITEVQLVEQPGVIPEVLESLRHSFDAMLNTTGTIVVSDRGVIRSVSLELPRNLDPNMTQSVQGITQAMDQLWVPLPEEAVGAGARWEHHMVGELNGILISQVTTFELLERKGKTADLKLSIRRRADPQEVRVPGFPSEIGVELHSMSGSGTGELACHLDRTHPHGITELSSRTTMSMNAQGREMDMTMSMELQVGFEGK